MSMKSPPPAPVNPDVLRTETLTSAGRSRSFTWSNILFRACWNVTWALLASWTPPPLHGWRRFLLNLFGARIARGARVYGSAKIWFPPNLEMLEGSMLGFHAICYCQGPVRIGRRTIVSQYAHLVSGTHDPDSETFQLFTKPIDIGDDAWVAADAFVGPGVTIGEGAVLGARGVAVKNLEPWTIYGGNPAQVLRGRRHFNRDG